MSREEVILRFEEVSFDYGHNHPILHEVSFPLRQGAKVALMGQNGAGKSTIFQLVTGELKPESGQIHLGRGLTMAVSRQVIPRDQMNLTVREFFERCFIVVYERNDRFSIFGGILFSNDNGISVKNTILCHTITPDAQSEMVS